MTAARATLMLMVLLLVHGGDLLAQQRGEQCGPWTDWSLPPNQGLSFSFRECETPSGRIRIEWRWANMSDRDLSFAFWLYTKDPVNCEQRDQKAWASGKHRLGAGDQDEFARGRKTVGAMAVDFWLFWCVVIDEGSK